MLGFNKASQAEVKMIVHRTAKTRQIIEIVAPIVATTDALFNELCGEFASMEEAIKLNVIKKSQVQPIANALEAMAITAAGYMK